MSASGPQRKNIVAPTSGPRADVSPSIERFAVRSRARAIFRSTRGRAVRGTCALIALPRKRYVRAPAAAPPSLFLPRVTASHARIIVGAPRAQVARALEASRNASRCVAARAEFRHVSCACVSRERFESLTSSEARARASCDVVDLSRNYRREPVFSLSAPPSWYHNKINRSCSIAQRTRRSRSPRSSPFRWHGTSRARRAVAGRLSVAETVRLKTIEVYPAAYGVDFYSREFGTRTAQT